MGYETQSICSCVFFFFFWKNPWKIFRYIHLLFLLFGWATQTRKKESCMYFSCQLFFKTPHETLKFQQKSCFCRQKRYKQTLQNGLFSTDIHWKKNHVYNLYFCSQKECQKCIFRLSADLNFNFFFFTVHPGDNLWDSELSKLWKTESLRENGSR